MKTQLHATLLLLLFSSFTVLAESNINTTFFGNLAVEGFDTVAYFTENKPVEGSKKYQTTWQGANWRFSSQTNLDLFKQDPSKYAPQYGGYCAYAVSKNKTASIEPELFVIHNDKLYLSYSKSVSKKFKADRDGYIQKAETNWPRLRSK